jgi:predicted PurR-regulated permease PerM
MPSTDTPAEAPAASTPATAPAPAATPIEEAALVPEGLRRVAAWSWRILVVLALATVVLLVVARLEVLFVALFVALLVTSLLTPAASWLRRAGAPRVVATVVVLLGSVAALVGVVLLVGYSVIGQAGALSEAVLDGIAEVRAWAEERFGLSLAQVESSASGVLGSLGGGEGGGGIVGSAFGAASTAFEVLAGAGITLFATIFFVHDGGRIWRWCRSLFPQRAHDQLDGAATASWQTMSSYARATVLIAAIDGIGIGVGAALIGVPLALPIGVLVFFGAFIPIVGALVTGLVAVLIALATMGITAALLMAAVVIAVQQLEGHVLQPLIQSKLVAIHPLAVVLAVAAGSTIAGIIGAVIAVPIVAVANVLVRHIAAASRAPAVLPAEVEANP